MPYVNSMVRDAIARGEALGRQQGLLHGQRKMLAVVLESRFGTLPQTVAGRIEQAGEASLSHWAERVASGASLSDILDAE